jgi:hypothetical protein
MLQIGIIGLPNVGKSTLFNALTRAHAEVSNYPFTTIDRNEAVVPVRDERLDVVAATFKQEKKVPTAVKFVDIAGLVKGAHRGEGLGNQFLSHIREVDAVLHLVRCFESATVAHVEGDVDPVRDAETVELELMMKDMETVERRIEKAQRSARVGDKKSLEEIATLNRIQAHLSAMQPARTLKMDDEISALLSELFLLTIKPVLYCANVSENPSLREQSTLETLASWAQARTTTVSHPSSPISHPSSLITISAKIAADLSELSDEEAAEFAHELGLDQTALEQVVRASYELLDVITFFTAVGKEASSWTVQRNTPAPKAAGKIHSAFEQGFIRAEVCAFSDLTASGSWQAAHDKGLVRVRGKDYLVQDGDVIHFRVAPK